ncbi:MAG TPA: ABC transporter permease [Bryobacteraceae bacterium]|nr:ABC transporter permease [Bryobacteraceae bacterium]
MIDDLMSDLKHAFRILFRSPGFTATAVSALALGIGANTAIFSVVNAVLLKPLPYPAPDRIVELVNTSPQGSYPGASPAKYAAWHARTDVLEDITAYDNRGPGVNITGGDQPEQVPGIHVSHEFFRLFGARLALGRAFSAEEDRPRGPNVVVISNGLWQRRFGSDPHIVGKAITLGRDPYTVIGVLAASFAFDPNADLYLPFQADPNSEQQDHYFSVAARLKPGVGVAAANAALASTAEAFRRKFPNNIGPKDGFGVEPMQEIMVRDVRTALFVLLGAVGFVLLIACTNIASLQLARAAARSREIAIRTAIGAGRWRIVRQLLTESIVLATLGGVLGLLLGIAGVRALLAINSGNLPRIGADGSGVTLDARVLVFTLLLSVLTGILFGLFPAIHASRTDLNSTLKESGSRSGASLRQNRSRAVLVVTEIALATVLLIGAGLLMRTFAALHQVAPGFDSHNVLTMETSLTGDRYNRTAAIADLARQAQQRFEALPGVEAAAATCCLPLEGAFGLGFIIEGRPLGDRPVHGGAKWEYVDYRYFDVFKIPIVRGRAFNERDTGSSPGVVMINESFARRYWPKQDPLGQRLSIRAGSPIFLQPPKEIVGIFADARDSGLNHDPQPEIIVPVSQVPDGVMALNNRFVPLQWVVRTRVPPFSLAAPVEQVFRDLADMPAAHLRTMDQVMAQSTSRNRFNTVLLGIFALVAILLAAIGLYGLIAYSVEQRTMEFGIRLALGANSARLRNMVLGQAMWLATVGIVLGLAAAFALTRVIASLLYDVKPTDGMVFGSVACLLIAVALLASYLPAQRAFRIDPAIALRYE